MKRILFIAYYFPPMGGSGVQRSLKFVKYLTEFNYLPVVLTVNPRFTRWPKDKSLLHEIPENVSVYRTPTLDLNWIYKALWGLQLHKVVEWLQLHWLIPDSEITWLPFAKKQITAILKKHKIDIVYITGGPFSSMLLGPYISDKFKLKYVVDFRDEWTNNPYLNDMAIPDAVIKKNNFYEKKVLSKSSGIVYTHSRCMKENFESKYIFLVNKTNIIITNGYDENDFMELDQIELSQATKLKIVYIGTFYGRRQPKIIWDALSDLVRTDMIDPMKIEIKIIGKNTKKFVLGNYHSDILINSIVGLYDHMPYARALAEMKKADVILLFIAPGAGSEAELPGKLFDYLRIQTPILALIPPQGTAAEIIRKSKSGFVYDSSNLQSVQRGLLNICSLWERGDLNIFPDKKYISKFDRKWLTAELAGLFDKVLST